MDWLSPILKWVSPILNICFVVLLLLQYYYRIKYGKEFANAKNAIINSKDEVIKSKDETNKIKDEKINFLERQIEHHRALNPEKMRSYYQASLEGMEERINYMEKQLETAKNVMKEKEEEINKLKKEGKEKEEEVKKANEGLERITKEANNLSNYLSKFQEEFRNRETVTLEVPKINYGTLSGTMAASGALEEGLEVVTAGLDHWYNIGRIVETKPTYPTTDVSPKSPSTKWDIKKPE